MHAHRNISPQCHLCHPLSRSCRFVMSHYLFQVPRTMFQVPRCQVRLKSLNRSKDGRLCMWEKHTRSPVLAVHLWYMSAHCRLCNQLTSTSTSQSDQTSPSLSRTSRDFLSVFLVIFSKRFPQTGSCINEPSIQQNTHFWCTLNYFSQMMLHKYKTFCNAFPFFQFLLDEKNERKISE